VTGTFIFCSVIRIWHNFTAHDDDDDDDDEEEEEDYTI
jgi:hypothetical protein